MEFDAKVSFVTNTCFVIYFCSRPFHHFFKPIIQIGLMPNWVTWGMLLIERFFFTYSYWYFWQKHGLDPDLPLQTKCSKLEIKQDEYEYKRISVHTSLKILIGERTMFTSDICYDLYSDGNIKYCANTLPARFLRRSRRLISIPRVGYTFSIRPDLQSVTYHGLGPRENYPDRKSHCEHGIWTTTPSTMGYNYIFPSENGNRSDCQWVMFTRGDATDRPPSDLPNGYVYADLPVPPNGCKYEDHDGFMIIAGHHCGETYTGRKSTAKSNVKHYDDYGDDDDHDDDGFQPKFHLSALLHSQQELHRATHTHELEERRDGEGIIHCNIDSHLMGIGGDVGWSPCVYDDYLLKPCDMSKYGYYTTE